MHKTTQTDAVSESIGTMLIIILIVALIAVIASLVMGTTGVLTDPTITYIDADPLFVSVPVTPGSATEERVRIIEVSHESGDTLRFGMPESSHEQTDHYKLYVIPPDGKFIEPVTSATLQPIEEIRPAEKIYIFYDGNNLNDNYGFFITNDISGRIDKIRNNNWRTFLDLSEYPKPSAGSSVAAAGTGTWKVVVVDLTSQMIVSESVFEII